LDLIKAEIK